MPNYSIGPTMVSTLVPTLCVQGVEGYDVPWKLKHPLTPLLAWESGCILDVRHPPLYKEIKAICVLETHSLEMHLTYPLLCL